MEEGYAQGSGSISSTFLPDGRRAIKCGWVFKTKRGRDMLADDRGRSRSSNAANLVYFSTSQSLSQRQIRWAQELSKFYFEIVHRRMKIFAVRSLV